MTCQLVFGDHIRLLEPVYADGHTYPVGLECTIVRSWPRGVLYALLMDGCDAAMMSPEYIEYEIITKEQTQ